jgi:hypothetical protein
MENYNVMELMVNIKIKVIIMVEEEVDQFIYLQKLYLEMVYFKLKEEIQIIKI